MTLRISGPDPAPEVLALTAPPDGEPPITMAALAHCDTLFEPFLGWASALPLNGTLDRRDHELLAMRTAHLCHSSFEWDEHTFFARRAGLTDEEIERIRAGADEPGWTAAEATLLRVADELHTTHEVTPATWQALQQHYRIAEIVEALYVVGQYTMLSMVANVVEG